ncbi:MAG: HNH endonuclease [bacterium]
MPRGASTPCRAPGCARLSEPGSGYCAGHRSVRTAGRPNRGSSTQQGYGARWRKIRRRQLAREPLCRHCQKEGRVTEATEVDHIKPRSQGGTDADENLQSLCKAHHSRKTAHEVNERKRRRRGRGG